MYSQLLRRYEKNPIIRAQDVPYPCDAVYNPAVAEFNGKTYLVPRILGLNGKAFLGLASSDDGINFKVHSAPFMTPSQEEPFKTYEAGGLEDPRVTQIGNEYYITYSAYSKYGWRIGLARTRDFIRVDRIAIITESDHRNTVLFPEKINGEYVRLDRPITNYCPMSIWISYSPDLIHWGRSKVIIAPQRAHWDEKKVGPAGPPIKTPQGWLTIIHGVWPTAEGVVYRLGAALLDLNDPSTVLGVADDFILGPETLYERVGYVHNVVFSCGAVVKNGNDLWLYYAGADQCCCLAFGKVDELVELCLKKPRPAV